MKKKPVTELNRLEREEFINSEKLNFSIVVDNVRSLYNVGAIFRTSDAFRVEHIYLCGITATPPNAEIHKTALGAEETVSWSYFSETMDAVNELKSNEYEIYAIEQVEGSIALHEFTPCEKKKYALVLGNEVKGVDQNIVDVCDGAIEIPQFGTKHSLNVSVTAGIVIWEMACKMGIIN